MGSGCGRQAKPPATASQPSAAFETPVEPVKNEATSPAKSTSTTTTKVEDFSPAKKKRRKRPALPAADAVAAKKSPAARQGSGAALSRQNSGVKARTPVPRTASKRDVLLPIGPLMQPAETPTMKSSLEMGRQASQKTLPQGAPDRNGAAPLIHDPPPARSSAPQSPTQTLAVEDLDGSPPAKSKSASVSPKSKRSPPPPPRIGPETHFTTAPRAMISRITQRKVPVPHSPEEIDGDFAKWQEKKRSEVPPPFHNKSVDELHAKREEREVWIAATYGSGTRAEAARRVLSVKEMTDHLGEIEKKHSPKRASNDDVDEECVWDPRQRSDPDAMEWPSPPRVVNRWSRQ